MIQDGGFLREGAGKSWSGRRLTYKRGSSVAEWPPCGGRGGRPPAVVDKDAGPSLGVPSMDFGSSWEEGHLGPIDEFCLSPIWQPALAGRANEYSHCFVAPRRGPLNGAERPQKREVEVHKAAPIEEHRIRRGRNWGQLNNWESGEGVAAHQIE